MSKQDRQIVTKDTVPDNFTLKLALVDAIPVIFFGASMVVISMLFSSSLFLIGALLCLFAGTCKVLWKIVVVIMKKNIWFLFVQMRITMPLGFLLMIISLVVNRNRIHLSSMAAGFTSFPSVIFFIIGIVGMVFMSVFAVKLDNADVKANWIEQITNGIAQIAFFIGLVMLL